MGNFINIAGQRFGRLLAVGPTRVESSKAVFWKCQCDCGTVKNIDGQNLRYGHIKSCGCLNRELASERNKLDKLTHGCSKTPEYRAWQGMWQRCSNPLDKNFKNYGGRGISVCERWLSFEVFLTDMGKKPSPRHSLDRFPNNDGWYEPENCRWATPSQQRRNCRLNLVVSAFGKVGALAGFFPDGSSSPEYKRAIIRIRRFGWNAERAIAEPPTTRSYGRSFP